MGDKIWRAVKVSAPLMILSEVLIYLFAVPLGVLCAVYRETWTDRLVSFLLFLLYSVPSFVAAMILLSLFSYGQVAEWFPDGRAALRSCRTTGLGRLPGRLRLARLFADRVPVDLQPGRAGHVHPHQHARRALAGLHPHARAVGVPGYKILFKHACATA